MRLNIKMRQFQFCALWAPMDCNRKLNSQIFLLCRLVMLSRRRSTAIMNERLVKYLNENSTMNDNQIGFRKGFRTSDHVFVLNTILNSYFSHNKPVYACFVDFPKAYDSVWRIALFYKLMVNQASCRFIKLIQSMYSGLKSGINQFLSPLWV